MPPGFSWVDGRKLAALAMPAGPRDLEWLRRQGIDVLISLTEEPPPRRDVNDAGLLNIHVPVTDFTAPTPAQFDAIVGAIRRAHANGMAAAVHCAAGRGRTGTALAAYFVARGDAADVAIERVRELRPGSVETFEQEEAVEEYARRVRGAGGRSA